MASAFLMLLLIVAAFLVFGSLGGMLGERLERRGVGEYLAPSLAMIFGGGGVALALWIVNMLNDK